jgi:hypothetical protein
LTEVSAFWSVALYGEADAFSGKHACGLAGKLEQPDAATEKNAIAKYLHIGPNA